MHAQQAGGVAAGEPTFRPIRSVSGTKGSVQGGRYTMEDPRTVFYVPDDKQIIVYFEWEGPLGPHKFEGYWKNPEGKVSVISDFSFDAKQKRYGGYWTLLLHEQMPKGLWTLEARVDGEVAGTHTFQILGTARPADLVTTPERAPLSTAQLYQQALASVVTVERWLKTGEKHSSGLGFVAGEDLVATAFQVIESAAALKIIFPDGRIRETSELVSWNRRQDWVLLRVPTGSTPKLKRASASSVGDRCFSLDVPSEGNRTLTETALTGKGTFPGAGDRWHTPTYPSAAATGGPVLNEYGEWIGLIGGGLVPGSSLIERLGRMGMDTTRGGLVIPEQLVSLIPPRAATLAQMHTGGHFTPPLLAHRNVLSGTTALQVTRQFGVPVASSYETEFTRKDKEFGVVLLLDPKEKRKGLVTLRIWDIDNRPLATTKPTKVDLKIGQQQHLNWTVPLTTIAPGVYRLDICLDEDPMWRGYIRVKD
jgi:hypothetical protein